LIGQVGDPVTIIFDKIKDLLGNYEYFYDIEGKFNFREKKTFLFTNWNEKESEKPEEETEALEEEGEVSKESEYSYEFNDLSLFSTFSDAPDLKNLKNDFTVWGTRKSISGNELPIHMRVAIDKKPEEYVNIDGTKFTNKDYDWRELIYQMALDYQKWKIGS
jgi:hypothetical protein